MATPAAIPEAAPTPSAGQPTEGKWGNRLVVLAFLLPAAILLIVWLVYPTIRTIIRSHLQPVPGTLRRFNDRRFFPANLLLAQGVQAKIGHNAVKPGVKAAIEPERMKIPVDAQKRLLVHVTGIFR